MATVKNKTNKSKTKNFRDRSGIWINLFGGDSDASNWETTWVNTGVSCRAENFAKGNIFLYRDSRGKVGEVKTHPFLDIIKKNNSYEQSFYEILYLISCNLDVYGKSFVYAVPNGVGKPVEFVLLPTPNVTILFNSAKTEIVGYEYRSGSGTNPIKYSADEIIYFRLPSLTNSFAGTPTIKSLEKVIDVDNYQQMFQIKSFKNDGRVNTVIEVPAETELSDEAWEALTKMQASKVGIENSNSNMILTGGAQYKDMKITNRELDYADSREVTRDEILGKLRVPKTIVGLAENSNRATSQAEMTSFIENVIKPLSRFIVDKFNSFIKRTWGEDLYITMEWTLPTSLSTDDIYFELFDREAVTVEELRSYFGFSSKMQKSKK